jgi:hypothetical protein
MTPWQTSLLNLLLATVAILNVLYNPALFPTEITPAAMGQEDACDPETEPCCTNGNGAVCENGEWICLP